MGLSKVRLPVGFNRGHSVGSVVMYAKEPVLDLKISDLLWNELQNTVELNY